jgi:hypothetical protein
MKYFFLICTLLFSLVCVAQPPRQITVAVDIESELLPAKPQDWTVYIYAAKPNSRLPLAALKTTLDKLPLDVILKQSMFLLPTHTLGDFEQVIVSVTVSKDSDPHKHSAEDLIGRSSLLSFELSDELNTAVRVDQLDVRQ